MFFIFLFFCCAPYSPLSLSLSLSLFLSPSLPLSLSHTHTLLASPRLRSRCIPFNFSLLFSASALLTLLVACSPSSILTHLLFSSVGGGGGLGRSRFPSPSLFLSESTTYIVDISSSFVSFSSAVALLFVCPLFISFIFSVFFLR